MVSYLFRPFDARKDELGHERSWLSQNIATGRKRMGGPTVPRGRVRLRRHRVYVDEQTLCATCDPRTRETASETASLAEHFAHLEVR